jgi:fluoroacetyl-CoA thioesterase
MGLAVGLRATVRHVVTEADTAIRAGSGDVPVLATPRLLALAEAACVAALESHLGAGMTSVGTGVALEHRRPSPVGTDIEVEAELTELTGRKLVFGFIVRHVRPDSGGGPADGSPGSGGPGSGGPGSGGPGSGGPAGESAADDDTGEDEERVVGAGTVTRIVVDRAKFLARAGVPAG